MKTAGGVSQTTHPVCKLIRQEVDKDPRERCGLEEWETERGDKRVFIVIVARLQARSTVD
jgi:hypothetical protein